MRLPARFVGEDVKNAKGRRSNPKRKPGCRCRFLLDYRQTAAQKTFHDAFSSRFCFESYKQRLGHHSGPPLIVSNCRSVACLPHGEARTTTNARRGW
jgi:hypothetical protein